MRYLIEPAAESEVGSCAFSLRQVGCGTVSLTERHATRADIASGLIQKSLLNLHSATLSSHRRTRSYSFGLITNLERNGEYTSQFPQPRQEHVQTPCPTQPRYALYVAVLVEGSCEVKRPTVFRLQTKHRHSHPPTLHRRSREATSSCFLLSKALPS